MVTKSTCIIPQPDHIGPIDYGNKQHPLPEIYLSEFGKMVRVINLSEKFNLL